MYSYRAQSSTVFQQLNGTRYEEGGEEKLLQRVNQLRCNVYVEVCCAAVVCATKQLLIMPICGVTLHDHTCVMQCDVIIQKTQHNLLLTCTDKTQASTCTRFMSRMEKRIPQRCSKSGGSHAFLLPFCAVSLKSSHMLHDTIVHLDSKIWINFYVICTGMLLP